MLVPRTIPMMEERPEKPMTLRRGNAAQHARIRKTTRALRPGLPDHRLSATHRVRRQGRHRRMRYAESLFKTSPREKGNRNEIEGKEFIGNYDEFVLDGGAHRAFRPLWWRTWRYLQLEIETKRRAGHAGRDHGHGVQLPLRAQGDASTPASRN